MSHHINIDGGFKFNSFDVVSDVSDHYYIVSNNKGYENSFNFNGNVYKCIMQEWRTLEKNLPNSIYVRAYEKRIDLLRAVIIGAAGTPYHDGLFFFDIAFPPQYPNEPPKVHYHSFGFSLNPNLYSSGKVCLSLLGTWFGSGYEKWNKSRSTILQVLISIQALILNEKPYFNEPLSGILGQNLWDQTSQNYNEKVFTLSCKTMLSLLHKPPKNFEDFIKCYFNDRSNMILRACIAYAREENRVGYFAYNGPSASKISKVKVSRQFKRRIEHLYPLLLEDFKATGASLETFDEQLVVVKGFKLDILEIIYAGVLLFYLAFLLFSLFRDCINPPLLKYE